MNQSVSVSTFTASLLISSSIVSLGSAQGNDSQPLPSAEALLNVPVSGNPIGTPGNPQTPAVPADSNAIAQGEALFHSMNCDGCHAPKGGGGMGSPLSDSAWIYGGEPAQIYLSIAQGRPAGMPAWGQSLPPASIWNLVAYIQTLGPPPRGSRAASGPQMGTESSR